MKPYKSREDGAMRESIKELLDDARTGPADFAGAELVCSRILAALDAREKETR